MFLSEWSFIQFEVTVIYPLIKFTRLQVPLGQKYILFYLYPQYLVEGLLT